MQELIFKPKRENSYEFIGEFTEMCYNYLKEWYLIDCRRYLVSIKLIKEVLNNVQ